MPDSSQARISSAVVIAAIGNGIERLDCHLVTCLLGNVGKLVAIGAHVSHLVRDDQMMLRRVRCSRRCRCPCRWANVDIIARDCGSVAPIIGTFGPHNAVSAPHVRPRRQRPETGQPANPTTADRRRQKMGRCDRSGSGRVRQLCPGTSDVDFRRDLNGVVDLDAEVANSTLDLSVPGLPRRLPVRR